MNPAKYITEAVQKSSKPVFFEIGAAKLEDTPEILKLIVDGDKPYEYYAFEPDPRNLVEARSTEAVRVVNLIPAAVGNTIGYVEFNQSGGKNPTYGYEHTLSGSLKKPKLHLQAHPWCKFDSTIRVRSMTLDSFCCLWSISAIDFIWCDVQGAEDLVIEGAQDMLEYTRFLYTEYYESEMYDGQIGVQAMLSRLPGEWVVQEIWPNDVIFRNKKYE